MLYLRSYVAGLGLCTATVSPLHQRADVSAREIKALMLEKNFYSTHFR